MNLCSTDIGECHTGNGGCETERTNNDGGVVCFDDSGYSLKVDSLSWGDMNTGDSIKMIAPQLVITLTVVLHVVVTFHYSSYSQLGNKLSSLVSTVYLPLCVC